MVIMDLKSLVENERWGWEQIQQLRKDFSPRLFNDVRADSRDYALDRGIEIIQEVLSVYKNLGLDITHIEPGHGVGHMVRDYTNALTLLRRLETDPKDIFIGFVGGTLHDAGCALVERYSEQKRVIRHAEVGALLFMNAADNADLNSAEKTLISYGIAAHTNYLTPSDVKCLDGTTRRIEPYPELDDNDKPLTGILIPRMVDRLDCVGAGHAGRHYLTIEKPRKEFSETQFVNVVFDKHMRPLLRTPEEIRTADDSKTMLEHFKMFADSQNNNSPYGKYDFGAYIPMRDEQAGRTLRIIDAVVNPRKFRREQQNRILAAWDLFLLNNIEPEEISDKKVKSLGQMFNKLDEKTQRAWSNGFLTTMKEYQEWAIPRLQEIKAMKSQQRYLPGVIDDFYEVILPSSNWTEKLRGF